MPVQWTAVTLNSIETAVESIVPEASSEQTRAPSEVMIEGARQRIPAAGGIKACHLRDPAAVVCREVVVVVAAAADAEEDSRPGTTQPILNGGNSHDATDQ
jgi:hypothetical protein